MKTLVIIPTYNEREALPFVLPRLRSAQGAADVLIVDDNSPDGTGQWADGQASLDGGIHVMHREGKGGLGAAYLAGFEWGLERGYEVLCEFDADGSHRPEQLGGLLAAVASGADLAIGSRWIRGGSTVNWPWTRQFISRGGNLYVRLMLRLGVNDATAGFRAYRASLLRSMDLAGVEARGYAFQVDMTRRARRVGATIVEVPISFVERERGESKMSGDIVREAMILVTRWGLNDLLRRPS